jgi:hypothetical protein
LTFFWVFFVMAASSADLSLFTAQRDAMYDLLLSASESNDNWQLLKSVCGVNVFSQDDNETGLRKCKAFGIIRGQMDEVNGSLLL